MTTATQVEGGAIARNADSIRVVLFDVGGVLVQLNGIAPMLQWLGFRIATEELWHTWLHSPSVRAFETGRMTADEFADALIGELGITISPQHFLDSFTAWPSGLYPGTLEMIARIPARYTRAVLSNSNALHWPRVMNELGLGSAFDHYFVSHLIGKIKPDAAAFEHVLETLECSAGHVLFLDDNLLNVEAARRIGMEALVVRGAEEAQRALHQMGILPAAE